MCPCIEMIRIFKILVSLEERCFLFVKTLLYKQFVMKIIWKRSQNSYFNPKNMQYLIEKLPNCIVLSKSEIYVICLEIKAYIGKKIISLYKGIMSPYIVIVEQQLP